MKPSLKRALPFAKAFARLLHPFAEVVIHDLKKDQIEAIFNPLSQRELGDSSYLDRIDFAATEEIFGPYEKTNWDGRAMKSISVVLCNDQGTAEGFLCVNVDVSAFESANQLLLAFLRNGAEIEKDTQKLFADDKYEKINLFVQNYCRERQVSIGALNRKAKQEVIRLLEANGAFKGRNSAIYIGRVLGLSRATVYNYLKGKK